MGKEYICITDILFLAVEILITSFLLNITGISFPEGISRHRGHRMAMDFHGNTVHFDATNPEAREYVWHKVKQNYYDLGIKIFWLDEAEPEYTYYDFDLYRYHLGPNVQVGNIYPALYAKGFFDGMKAAGQENIINLVRCAWAGSQRYGALVWSGDIHSSFASLRNQVAAGLNISLKKRQKWLSLMLIWADKSFNPIFVV